MVAGSPSARAAADIRPKDGDVWVALDRVRDPGNLGTVIRTDTVGAKGVILVGDTTDPFSVETVRHHAVDSPFRSPRRPRRSQLAQGFFRPVAGTT